MGRKITGEFPTYITVHSRLKRKVGSASEFTCVDCGKRAAHWSLSWRRIDSEKLLLSRDARPYTTDQSDYDTRCAMCAYWYDRDVQS